MKAPTNLHDLRAFYSRAELTEESVSSNPITQFGQWFDEATEAQVTEPNAFTLATASRDGRPSARVILLKGFDEGGFAFFTNYESRKGRELLENPQATLVFWWAELERQVRIEGTVSRISEEDSDTYFRERPRGSQLGAWASAQSSEVASRKELAGLLEDLERRFEGQDVPRPTYWGGFLLQPHAVEFWQGRPDRLHDRLLYRRETGGGPWTVVRLAP